MDARGAEQHGQEVDRTIVAWLQRHAIPLRFVEAGHGFDDLLPLKALLNDVKVVGLGESTHGTREMFQLKHRLLEFLVMEMGFSTFAIEASLAACQPINDYVLCGRGDLTSALTAQWYVPWDTEEIACMLEWMRTYNQSASDERKVRFSGVDITRNDPGRQAVLGYLRRVAPDRVDAAATLFAALGDEEAKWPQFVDSSTRQALLQLLPGLEGLIDLLTANRDEFTSRSSSREFEQALQYVRIMRQFIIVNAAASTANDAEGAASVAPTRSTYMAENLVWLAEQAKPDAKLVIWAHNGHIAVADDPTQGPNLGSSLRQRYGDAYYALGFEFGQGSFLQRVRPPAMMPGDLKEVTLPLPPEGTLPWYLSRAGLSAFILNLRGGADDLVVDHWLITPQPVHHVPWAYSEAAAAQGYLQMRSVNQYDGILFVERGTASRPTANALKAVSQRDGL